MDILLQQHRPCPIPLSSSWSCVYFNYKSVNELRLSNMPVDSDSRLLVNKNLHTYTDKHLCKCPGALFRSLIILAQSGPSDSSRDWQQKGEER